MSKKQDIIDSFLGRLDEPVDYEQLAVSIVLATVLSLILRVHFRYFGTGFSSNKDTGDMIPFLVLIVTLVITIIRSSLELSLGLVGALSIVRFRTPIKEVEELTYIFMAIAIGIGLGAGQLQVTLFSTLAILSMIAIFRLFYPRHNFPNMYVGVEWNATECDLNITDITKLLSQFCPKYLIRRFDHSTTEKNVTFHLDNSATTENIARFSDELIKKYPQIHITMIDQNRSDV